MSNTPKIDEILEAYRRYLFQDGEETQLAYPENVVKQALFQLILEVIGEDEETVQTKVKMYPPKIRNTQRQEQRQKLSDLFNIKEDVWVR